MVRPIEYNYEEVLDGAMNAFWFKGYEATTLRDLVSATRLNTRTMYNLFGDKSGLFYAALQNYNSKKQGPIYEILENERGMAAIHSMLNHLVKARGASGCLFVNTLSERNSVQRKSLRLVEEHFRKMEDLLSQKLTEAKRDGEFSGKVATMSNYLICFLQGMAMFSKYNQSVPERKELIKTALKVLES